MEKLINEKEYNKIINLFRGVNSEIDLGKESYIPEKDIYRSNIKDYKNDCKKLIKERLKNNIPI